MPKMNKLDLTNALERLENDETLLLDLINGFLAIALERFEDVKDQLDMEDGLGFYNQIHKLRGIISIFSDCDVYKQSLHLEELALNGTLPQLKETFSDFEVEYTQFVKDLYQYSNENK